MEFSTAIRWLMLASSSALVGAQTLLLMSGTGGGTTAVRWRETLRRVSAVLVVAWIALSFVALAIQAATVSGRDDAAWQWSEWRHVLERTQFGAVWMLRTSVALLLLAVLLWTPSAERGRRVAVVGAWALAVIVQCAAAWSGHGAAVEPVAVALVAVVAHLLFAGLWAGALPWLVLGFAHAARADVSDDYRQWMRSVMLRFSSLGAVSVVVVVASGAVMTYLLVGAPTEWPARAGDWLAGMSTTIERIVAPLLSTRFGRWVLFKVGLLLVVLWLASGIRWLDLPRLVSGTPQSWQDARRRVLLEALVIAVLLWAATVAASTIPAAHDVMVWPLPFRVSLAATWDQPNLALWLTLASLGLMTAVVTGARPWARIVMRQPLARQDVRGALLGVVGVAAATGVMLWALAVPAYPQTYLRSEVPYDAVSIARGMALYPVHCAQCHGEAARGDGPLAAKLAKPPVDLAEPHTALHTAGDIFYWLTDGKPNSPMPGFRDSTSADDRWDLVNFLRLFSSGYQARILTPKVIPGQPWLGAPNFDYVDAEGKAGALKNARGQVVLLVFYSLPTSQARLSQLVELHPRLRERGVEVIALPLPGSPAASAGSLPFVLPVDGAAEAAKAYLLLRRTRADPGKTIADEVPAHMEFLIDRFGYVRARWLPSPQSQEWRDANYFLQQVDVLRDEPRLMPPPDDHVH